MILYSVIILVCMAVISSVSILFQTPATELGALNIILAVTVSTVAVIALDGLGAALIRRLPEKWFAPGRRAFRVSRRECRIYQRLGVRCWKDKIPELGGFTNFRKNKVYHPEDNAYIERFLLECNYGSVIHLENALLGGLIVFLLPLRYALWIGLPVAAVNLVLSLLPLFALRYNTPKLEALHRLNLRRQSKNRSRV